MHSTNGMQGHSRLEWHDLYYDGDISSDEYYCEETGEINKIEDPWDVLCKEYDGDPGYIEDASDDWYLDMLHARIIRKER